MRRGRLLASHSIPTWFLYPYILPCQLVVFFSRDKKITAEKRAPKKMYFNTRRPAEHQKNNPDSTILYCIATLSTAYFVLKDEMTKKAKDDVKITKVTTASSKLLLPLFVRNNNDNSGGQR